MKYEINKLKFAIVLGLISTSPICHADTEASYTPNKEYAEFDNGTEILISEDSQAIVKPNSNANDVAEIFISPSDNKNISHNKYDKFNVDRNGIILNNTQANANYIINEVINNGPTSLIEGNIGVEGRAAHVIIANPNGIVCDGCGFSNTLSETLVSGSIHRTNSAVALYRTTPLLYESHRAYAKSSPYRGKVNIINSNKKDYNITYRNLNIISNGITINDKIISPNDINIFNNYSVTHHYDSTLTKYISQVTTRPWINRYRKNVQKSFSNNYLIIGEKYDTNIAPSSLNGSIYVDNNINIYAQNSKIENYGYMTSYNLNLSLSNNASFENYNFISIGNLTLDKDERSLMLNTESGYINYHLPFVSKSSHYKYSPKEIRGKEINKREERRIMNLMRNNELINDGIFHIMPTKLAN